MILMRLSQLSGLYCDIQGGNEYNYGDSGAGWFPIESMNFGFQAKSESTAGKAAGSANSGGAGGNSPVAQSPLKSGSKRDGDDTFTTISVSKFVDMTSTTLMKFAMEDRAKTKSDKDNMRQADFHLLHSVKGVTETGGDRFIFPYLMISLDNVLIKGWNINAAGDERPQETVELWYDKAAMRYFATNDGQVWVGGEAHGWDQSANEEWDGESRVDSKFFKKADLGKRASNKK